MFCCKFDPNLVPIRYGIHNRRLFKGSYRNLTSVEFTAMGLNRTQNQLCASNDCTSMSNMTNQF